MAGVETLAAMAIPAISALYKAWVGSLSEGEKTANLAADKIGQLAKEYQEKRDIYLTLDVDPETTTEKRRIGLLERLTASQNRILFEISDPDLVAKLVPFAIEQASSLYSVSKAPEFALIEMNIGQIEAMLQNNKVFKESRAKHRTMAIWFVAIVILGLITLISGASYVDLSTDTVIPVIKIPLPIVIWSCIGSLGAMLYRFNSSADAELADPLRWSFTRPLTGVVMGIIAYMAFKVGAVMLQPGAASGASGGTASLPISQELLWLAAFLAGFSDRFADSVLRSLTGRLGGDRNAELQTADQGVAPTRTALTALADRLGWGRGSGTSQQAPIPSPPAVHANLNPAPKRRDGSSKAARAADRAPQATHSIEPPAVAQADHMPASKRRNSSSGITRRIGRGPRATAQQISTEVPPADQVATKRGPGQRSRKAASLSSPPPQTVAQPNTVVAFPETAPKETS
jgi:hypothetical protein